jgi:hypothetical protein
MQATRSGFDRVVAENGAVLYTATTKAYRTLGEAPSRAFVSELSRRGVGAAVGRAVDRLDPAPERNHRT